MIRSALASHPTTDASLHRFAESGGYVPLSFEFSPRRSENGRAALREAAERLAPAATAGFSVTMGAGGTTRTETHRTSVEIAQIGKRPVMAHLTALGLTKDEALQTAENLWADGIHSILALRGDRPNGTARLLPPGYEHASDLLAAIRVSHPFEITVAAYPEKHPEADTLDADIDHLKEKIDAGASRAICQFVLDPAAYGRFLDDCALHGISAPIIPGIMPLEGWNRVRGFALANGVAVPDWLDRLFAHADDEPELMPYLSATATFEHARRLIGYGAPGLHVYTMNHWPLPLALARLLGHD